MSNPLAEAIGQLASVEERKKALNAELKELNEKQSYLEEKIIEKLQAEGLKKVNSVFGSVSVSKDVYPQIKDFDKFCKYVVDHKAFDLIMKQVKKSSYQEMLDHGEELPGVEAFEKPKVYFSVKKS